VLACTALLIVGFSGSVAALVTASAFAFATSVPVAAWTFMREGRSAPGPGDLVIRAILSAGMGLVVATAVEALVAIVWIFHQPPLF
jgi:hypothetical protein